MSTTALVWNPLTQPLDKFVLAGEVSPGYAELKGVGTPRKWEQRRSYGMGGATVWFLGRELAQFTIRIELWTEEDWAHWQSWRHLVLAPPFGRRPRALDIWHPILDEKGISSVVVLDCKGPEQIKPTVWRYDIECLAYRRPRMQLAKPEGSKVRPLSEPERAMIFLVGEVERLSRD